MLAGKRVVVVGASAGIGRAFAIQAVKQGAEVVFGARRTEVLEAAVAEAGGGHALAIDVCDGESRAAFLDGVRGAVGEIDLLLCSVGFAELRFLSDTDEEAWARMVATNLVGLNRLLVETIGALSPAGVMAVLSSESTRSIRHGLVPYAATKAALETTLRGLRVEHPGARVSCVVVGATFPTEFGSAFDASVLVPAMEKWQRLGVMQQEFMAPEDVAGCLTDLYGAALRYPGVCIEEVVLRSPSGVAGI